MKKAITLLALFLFVVLPCASYAGNKAVRVKFVFVDFYNDEVTVQIDRKVLWSGKLTVKPENETTGLSMIKEATVPKCGFITVRSKYFVDKRTICLTDKTKLVYISAKAQSHISTSERDVVELD